MTILSKHTARTEGRKVDLTRHTDEDLHNLMDSVTREMARRASVNAKRRALVRRLETLAEAEGVTLDEVRQYLRGEESFPEQPLAKPAEEVGEDNLPEFPEPKAAEPSMPMSPLAREVSLDRQLESMFKELG